MAHCPSGASLAQGTNIQLAVPNQKVGDPLRIQAVSSQDLSRLIEKIDGAATRSQPG